MYYSQKDFAHPGARDPLFIVLSFESLDGDQATLRLARKAPPWTQASTEYIDVDERRGLLYGVQPANSDAQNTGSQVSAAPKRTED